MICDFCDGEGFEDGPGFEWPIRCHVCGGVGIIEPEDEEETEMSDDGNAQNTHNNPAATDPEYQRGLKMLRDKIAEQDAARGRPLTFTEKLDNLEDALGMERGALRNR